MDQSGARPQRLRVYSGGFLWQRRVRRILTLAGLAPSVGPVRDGDAIGVWGDGRTAQRGLAVAARRGAPVVRIEDAFLRSVQPGRRAEPPLGLLIDDVGLHFDPAGPSRIERILSDDPLDDTALLDRARGGMARMRAGHLSKYTGFDPDAPVPDPGYVLVIDQVQGDAAVRASQGNPARFAEMLTDARLEHPGARIVVKSHPSGAGHLTDLPEGVIRVADPVSPWHLLEGAIAVYVLSSQMGFEAILAGHRPITYGQPFYAGWGLTEDRSPTTLTRRQRSLTRAQLFAGAMILAPHWYDPFNDRLGTFEDSLAALEAQTRAWREDHRGWVADGMRAWKRGAVRRFYSGAVRFGGGPARAARLGARHMVWGVGSPAGGSSDPDCARCDGTLICEDGFLRSRGLGAGLVPPLSLVLDDLGIYFDPTRESRLERQIADATPLPDALRPRVRDLIRSLTATGVSKYNVGGALPDLADLPEGRRILVVGQVEDDASIRLGAGELRTNRALLERARAENPDAVLLYKPHPDVVAGLRPGHIPDDLADLVLRDTDPVAAIGAVDEVWVITSLLGFEALLRGVPVTCLGAPFYAGWGLTRDLGSVPARRQARPDLDALTHAALIAYPRYRDPVTRGPCPPEIAIARLAQGQSPQGPALRALARAQGWLAGIAPVWR